MKVTNTSYEIRMFNKEGNTIAHLEDINRNDEDYLEQLSRKHFKETTDVKWRTQDGYERNIFSVMSYDHGDHIGDLQITTWQKWG